MEKLLESKIFTITSTEIVPFDQQYNGLISHQLLLKIRYLKADQEEKETVFFVKTVNESDGAYSQLLAQAEVYKKEEFFYNVMVPLLDVEGLMSEILPTCYLCEHPIIVLEDLTQSLYEPFERQENLTLEKCKKCLDVVAQFHAAPIIYEHRKSKSIGRRYRLTEDYGDILENKFTSDSELIKKYIETAIDSVLDLLRLLPEKNINFESFTEDFLQTIYSSSKSKTGDDSILTVLHSDLWPTNFLYRLKREQIEHCKLIDFQTICYGPPEKDLIQFLIVNTPMRFYKLHKDELVSYYYEKLSAKLRQHDIDASEILPEHILRENCEKFELYAKFYAVIDHSITMLPEDILQEGFRPQNIEKFLLTDRKSYLLKAFETDAAFREILSSDLYDIMEMLHPS